MSLPDSASPQAWSEAIVRRTSRRGYDPRRPVPPATLDSLELLAHEFRPWAGARAVVVRDAPAEVFTGIVGSYGRVSGSPSALLFVGTQGAPDMEAALGYVGEALVLAATDVGLGTCWIAGSFDREVARGLVRLADDDRVLGVSPLGYAKDRGADAFFSGWRTLHPRKPLATIAPGSDTWPGWARGAVEAARLAPSAVNRQPWRYSWTAEQGLAASVTPSGYGTLSPELDVGISMLHAEVAATAAGFPGSWGFTGEAPAIATYRPDEVGQSGGEA